MHTVVLSRQTSTTALLDQVPHSQLFKAYYPHKQLFQSQEFEFTLLLVQILPYKHRSLK